MKVKRLSYIAIATILLGTLLFAGGCRTETIVIDSEDPTRAPEETRVTDPEMVREADVGLPVYPGLKRISGYSARDFGGEFSFLNSYTEDASFEDVVAFYERELSDWNHMEHDVTAGMFKPNHIFWQGDPAEEYHPLTNNEYPSVTVHPPRGEGKTVQVNFFYREP